MDEMGILDILQNQEKVNCVRWWTSHGIFIRVHGNNVNNGVEF